MKNNSMLSEIWRRFKKNKQALVGLIVLILFVLIAIFADQIAPYGYDDQDASRAMIAPCAEHIFGTDNLGRDQLSRLIYGSRYSLAIGFLAVGISVITGGILGVLAAYYPKLDNIIMRCMDLFMAIPQMLLAGASCDDIYVIVLFTTFTGIAQGGNARAADFLNIPVSIVLGIAVGAAAGYALSRFFEAAFARNHMVRGSVKIIIVLSVSFLLVALETVLKGRIALSGLLAVTSMACMLARKTTGEVRARLSEKFGKLWIAAELILFVLVGAAVDIRYVSETGLAAVLMVFTALIFRAAGVVLCLAGTKLSRRERLFCVIAYLPKATVQAAIGSVPLAMGLPCGKIVLSVAVLAILITAPLGALGMDAAYRKLLKYEG